MSAILTPDGLKAWPLSGWQPSGQSFFPQRRGIDLLGLYNRVAYEQLYRTQPWVHALVNKLSRGIGRLPLCVLEDQPTGAPKEQDDSDLAELLRKPYPGASAFTLKEAMIGSLAVYGHSLIVPDFGDAPAWTKPPEALWPIPWKYVGVLAGVDEPIGAFVIELGNVRRILPPENVIHLQWWSPEGFMGTSPLEPLRTTLALEDATQRYTVSSFANGSRPSGAVRTEKPMNKTDRDQLRAEIEAMHGGIDNAFRVALLTHGLEWQPFSHSAVESELIAQRKLNREEVCAVYDIPPPLVQILDRATHSNIDEQHRMLYQDSYAPWYTLVEEGFESQMTAKVNRWKNMSFRFDVDAVLRGDEEKRSVASQRRFQSAQMTPNELRADEGREPAPGSVKPDGTLDEEHPANQIYIPVNMVPANKLDEVLAQPAPTDGGGPDGGDHHPTPEEQRSWLVMLEALKSELLGEIAKANVPHANGHSDALKDLIQELKNREPTATPDIHITFPEGFVKGGDVHVDAPELPEFKVEVIVPETQERTMVPMKFEKDESGRIVRVVPDTGAE